MLRRLLINENLSFASIGYSHQQLSRVPLGTANRHSQFHCPKSKISKVVFALEEDKQKGLGPYLSLVLYIFLLNNTKAQPILQKSKNPSAQFLSQITLLH